MRKFFKQINDNHLWLDFANIILGVIMIIMLVLVFTIQSNLALLFAVWAGGFMNMVNGFKCMKQKNKRNMGYSFVFTGLLIAVGGSLLVLRMMGMF